MQKTAIVRLVKNLTTGSGTGVIKRGEQLMNDEIYQAALDKYADLQVVVCMEEMAELARELSKHLRGKGNKEHIAEEIADVWIMLEQMIMFFAVENSVEKWQTYKLDRLRQRLDGA